MGISPECFFAGVCCGGLITLPLQVNLVLLTNVVYKGCLQNGKIIAIKRLTQGTVDEIIGDFLLKIGILAYVNHPNIAKLIGYGVEGGMHLVLELSAHGSLASMLYG
ncbi:unnamed protein product [Dovyalis caffra]|uniref:Serine-threonine/tyrosine-protein kinase catalytic domain-containing protein n=1 Tax=Dovyalis caffra TaxID=77055 RepID=A0AAV1RE93_9ROSI|nr:unnamed protein product [Dovyalis caffra]